MNRRRSAPFRRINKTVAPSFDYTTDIWTIWWCAYILYDVMKYINISTASISSFFELVQYIEIIVYSHSLNILKALPSVVIQTTRIQNAYILPRNSLFKYGFQWQWIITLNFNLKSRCCLNYLAVAQTMPYYCRPFSVGNTFHLCALHFQFNKSAWNAWIVRRKWLKNDKNRSI